MLNIYNVALFGHRDFNSHFKCEDDFKRIVYELLKSKEYVYFYIGREGEFDRFAASVISNVKNKYNDSNSSIIWYLPYQKAELTNNYEYYKDYYDRIEICEKSAKVHYKAAIKTRNLEMVSKADLLICYIEHNYGGAYQAFRYAQKLNKNIINLATPIQFAKKEGL